jgi:RNA polymerase sigma-70 factor (ECF subfamily)
LRQERLLDPDKFGDHLDRLYRAAWALCGSPDEAEDLVQEMFVRVLARPRRLRGTDDCAYLLGALRNTFLSTLRTAARRGTAEPLPGPLEEVEDRSSRHRPEAALDAHELYRAIAALPPGFRDALVMVDLSGLSYDQAARALRVPRSTLASRVFRGRRELVRALTPAEPSLV